MTFFSRSDITRCLALGSADDAVDGVFHLEHVDAFVAVASGEEGGLVEHVGEVGAGEAGGAAGQHVEVDVGAQRLVGGVDAEDLLTTLEIGTVDDDLAVEAARPQERGVEDVRAVGGGNEDDAGLHVEAIHLDEQLVEGLLPLVVPAAHAGAAVATDGIDLVHEDDGRRAGLGLLEEVAHPAGPDADEHLDEVRARDREERHPGLTGDGTGQQGLAGSRRPEEEHALGDLGPDGLELGRRLEELLDLVQLLARLRRPRRRRRR